MKNLGAILITLGLALGVCIPAANGDVVEFNEVILDPLTLLDGTAHYTPYGLQFEDTTYYTANPWFPPAGVDKYGIQTWGSDNLMTIVFITQAFQVKLDWVTIFSNSIYATAYDAGGDILDAQSATKLRGINHGTFTFSGVGWIAKITLHDGRFMIGVGRLEFETIIDVAVDIKPGSCPNPFNPKSKGSVPVGIVGSDDYDVNDIDPNSIELWVGEESVLAIQDHWSFEDSTEPHDGSGDPEECEVCFDADDPANFNCDLDGDLINDAYCGDGNDDLVVKFDTKALAAAIAAAGGATNGQCLELLLTGETFGGIPIIGSDSMWILKKIEGDAP